MNMLLFCSPAGTKLYMKITSLLLPLSVYTVHKLIAQFYLLKSPFEISCTMDKPFKNENFDEEDKIFSTWDYKYLGVRTLLQGMEFERSVLFAPQSCHLPSVLCLVPVVISFSAIFCMVSSLTSAELLVNADTF